MLVRLLLLHLLPPPLLPLPLHLLLLPHLLEHQQEHHKLIN
jgi:hypothetical protein